MDNIEEVKFNYESLTASLVEWKEKSEDNSKIPVILRSWKETEIERYPVMALVYISVEVDGRSPDYVSLNGRVFVLQSEALKLNIVIYDEEQTGRIVG